MLDSLPSTSPQIFITQHAFDRAAMRLNLSPSAFTRLVQKVRDRGRRHDTFSGGFRRYLDSMFFKHQIKEIYVYGEYVYPFTHDGVIPTVFRVPNSLKRYLKKEHKRTRPSLCFY